MSDLPQDQPAGEDELDLDTTEPEEGEELEPEKGEGEDGADEVEPEPQPAARQQRPGRNQRLRSENERLRTELAELRGRVDQIGRQAPAQQQGFDPRAAEREEQEFYAAMETMTPAEAVRAAVARERRLIGQAMQQQRLSTEDRIDKQAYDSQKASSALHAQYADRVEQIIAAERARGNVGITRDAVFKYLVGEDAIARATRAAPRQQRQAQSRVRQQTVPASSGRGDGRGGARPAADSLEAARERVRNQPLW